MFSRKRFCSAGEGEWHISGENDLSIKKNDILCKNIPMVSCKFEALYGCS